MDWAREFAEAFDYKQFLQRHATPEQQARWQAVYEKVTVTPAQRELLGGFVREMHVLCVAGAWCGDCVNQCPVLTRIGEQNPRIVVRFVDRDARPEAQQALAMNLGHRVPAVVFLSEDDQECGRYGDRTLAAYRQMAADRLGPACPTGIVPPGAELLSAVTAEWIGQFERIQLMLRLSRRLREKHGD
ncbi:MAG TPA: thioredoxin family protein [bacterium]|nr:thioredoxin family protein [bacterium]